MCDPVSLALAGSKAYGSVMEGQMAKGQAEMMAGQSEYQAKVEQQNALATAGIIRRAGRKQIGQATAGFAAAGVKVGEGSAGEVERQINQDVEHDAFQALLDGGRRARGLELDAKLSRIQGDQAEKAGYLNGVTSLLGSAASFGRTNGWRTGGPGFSGQQAPAPVETRQINIIPGRG